jgi:hypothetical protein
MSVERFYKNPDSDDHEGGWEYGYFHVHLVTSNELARLEPGDQIEDVVIINGAPTLVGPNDHEVVNDTPLLNQAIDFRARRRIKI